ncbi:unnamed protein product, partial [Brenthis ino]
MKEIYEVQADELMDMMLKNVHKGKFQLSVPIYKSTTKISASDMTERTATVVTKNAPKMYGQNLTLEELHLRKTKLDIKTLLESHVSGLPNFEDEDQISIQTRRFNNIQNSSNDTNLRGLYMSMSGATVNHRKNRIVQLMAQFVYQIRYQLPYAQLLRKKYNKNLRYRIGYCFALLRNLKRQQMVIFTTMKNYQERFLVLYAIIKLYEKVVKLDVDVKDLMKYIVHLDKVRQTESDVKFTNKG